MKDWRLINEEYFNKLIIHKVKFPDYWEESFLEKNRFYDLVYNEAVDIVKTTNRGKEYLEGIGIGKFWQRHCDLCTRQITTDDALICFCTHDFQTWLCDECVDDFKDRFDWSILKGLVD